MAMERVIIKFSSSCENFLINLSFATQYDAQYEAQWTANQHMPRSARNIYLTREAVKIIYFAKRKSDYKSFN